MNTFDITLDLDKRGLVQVVPIRQGDKSGTTIRASIYDHGAAAATSGMTARFSMRLPNGTEYYRKAASLSGNVATVALDETQAASVAGRTDTAYFQLLQGSTVVASTESFTVVVLPDALADATVPESYDSAIQDAIDALGDAVEQLPATVEDVLADHPEWTTTVQDGSITEAKLATDLARDRERLLYRLDNLLTNALPEGETATATDTAKTPMAALALYGRSTQDGTPTPSAPVPIVSVGTANLLNPTGINATTRGLTATYEGDGWIRISGTITSGGAGILMLWGSADPAYHLLDGGAYSLDYEDEGVLVANKVGLQVYGTNASGVNDYVIYFDGWQKFIAADKMADHISRVCLYYSASSAGTTIDGRIRIQMAKGLTAYPIGFDVPYVPYGHAGLWSRGRNLLDPMAILATTGKGITITPDSDGWYNVSGTVTGTGAGVIKIADIETFVSDSVALNVINDGAFTANKVGIQVTRTLNGSNQYEYVYANAERAYSTSGLTLLRFVLYITADATGTTVNGSFRLQLERGSTAHAYQPYESTVTPIPLDGHELRSLPNGTRDEVTVDERGHAVLVQRVGHIEDVSALTFNGFNANSHYITYALTPTGVNTATDKLNVMSDKFVASPSLANGACYVTSNGGLALFCDTSWTAQADAQAALAGVTLDYALATPQTIDLGTIDAVPLVGPDLTAQTVPTAPFALTYERDLNTTLARLESAIATLA